MDTKKSATLRMEPLVHDVEKNGSFTIANEKIVQQRFTSGHDNILEGEPLSLCDSILRLLACIFFICTFPITVCFSVRICYEYERALVFSFGRLKYKKAAGPGTFFVLPFVDSFVKVDLRTISFIVPNQEILSKDAVTVQVDAVVFFKIEDPILSVLNIEDATRSTQLLAQTTLRNMLGTRTLVEMLQEREKLAAHMQEVLDQATNNWGAKVERVEIKDIRLPSNMQRAMAAEAEATREANANIISAKGELDASYALQQAAETISKSPMALQLRFLQTLNTISAEKNSTIVFPFPIDLLTGFLNKNSRMTQSEEDGSSNITPINPLLNLLNAPSNSQNKSLKNKKGK